MLLIVRVKSLLHFFHKLLVAVSYTHLDVYKRQDQKTAVIEMASAAGITLVPDAEKNPLAATTYGVGEMILDAIRRGCRKFIIGIGGSATNDGGLGMLKALGFSFLDENGNDVGEGAQALSKIETISAENADPLLADCQFLSLIHI